MPPLLRWLAPGRFEWLDATGQSERGDLSHYNNSAPARSAHPLLVVPGEHVTLTSAQLPRRSRRAVQLKAAPFILEDELADAVENLHCACGSRLETTPSDGGHRLPVAVVSHAQMRVWLNECEAAGVKLKAIVPDTLLVPLTTQSYSVLIADDNPARCLVRTGQWSGFVCDLDTLPLLLQLSGHRSESLDPPTLTGPLLPALTTELNQANTVPALDLLQGPYSRRQTSWRQQLRPWRMAAMLAGLWCGLLLIQQGVDYWRLQRQQTQLKAQILALFKHAVPQARRIVNPRAQLNNRLNELRQAHHTGATRGDFFTLLRHSGQSLQAQSEIRLQSLRFEHTQVQLDLLLQGRSLEAFDQLQQQLKQNPQLSIDMRTIKRDARIESQLTVKKK